MDEITDRAKRYRAQQCIAPGPRRCAFCGVGRNVDVHHLNGDEDDGSPENLILACRSCNTIIGVVLVRAGIGRRTRQYNPVGRGATSLGQWMVAVMSMKGESDQMSVPAAVEMVRATPHARRSQFAAEIWQRRREHGTDRQEAPLGDQAPMLSKELIIAAMIGYAAGAGTTLAFLRVMIRGAMSDFETQLTAKFDKRYHLVASGQEY